MNYNCNIYRLQSNNSGRVSAAAAVINGGAVVPALVANVPRLGLGGIVGGEGPVGCGVGVLLEENIQLLISIDLFLQNLKTKFRGFGNNQYTRRINQGM